MDSEVTIVDDCAELRHLVRLLLRCDLGVSCLGLATLAEAQARAADVLASRVVILDINLGAGEPDGVAVYQWLIAQGYRGQVFFLTGHAKDSPSVRAAVQTGVRLLEKPMSPDELVRMLRDVLSQKQPLSREAKSESA